MGSFDVALLEALLSVGVAPERARALVEQFDRSIDARYSLHAQVLATKRDLAELEVRLNDRVSQTNVRLAEVDARVAEILAKVAETKADLSRWMLAALTAQTAILATLKLV